jgi:hypothetical protein
MANKHYIWRYKIMDLSNKVAYIKGLMEGLDLDKEKKEIKIMEKIVEVLEDMALEISELQDENDEIFDALDVIDEDLSELEDTVYEDDCSCADDIYYEVVCPECKEKIYLGEDLLMDGEVECSNCGKTLEFDFDSLVKDKPQCDCNCKEASLKEEED